jgi:cold shock CspA family protein
MRFDGKLEKWNDDRGFGFITPLHGGEPVFVHISAFPPDSRRPKIGEPLSFEVEPGRDGKKRAVNVHRPGHHPPPPAQQWRPGEHGRSSGLPLRSIAISVAIALALIGFGVYSYTKSSGRGHRAPVAAPDTSGVLTTSTPGPADARFRCDGRTLCSQMTSCEEATFFLRNCPGVQMDGNGDGIPCEKQWCGGGRRR